MDAKEFLDILNLNRHLLEDENSYTGDGCGCPLFVVVSSICDEDTKNDALGELNDTDPSPEHAAYALDMDRIFTSAIATGWDWGKFYDDLEHPSDWRIAMSGFLIGATLRPLQRMKLLKA